MATIPGSPLVCVVTYDGLSTLEFGIAVHMFGFPRPEFSPWYRFRIVAATRGPMRAIGGYSVVVDAGLGALRHADLIVIPGWPRTDDAVPTNLKRALVAAHRRGTRIASICSGAFVLAQCGLLDGRKATTHWRHAPKLAARFPAVEVVPNVLYVDEGDVLTSAGAVAGVDLCLHIVRKDFGANVANELARRMVMPAHRLGGQAQFISRPVPRVPSGSIAGLLDTVRRKLDEPWSLSRMAQAAHVSIRTLQRRFLAVTSERPHDWLLSERVSHAKTLLETTRATLTDVAAKCGFGSAESFRYHFRSRVGLSPTAYRAGFGVVRKRGGIAPRQPATPPAGP